MKKRNLIIAACAAVLGVGLIALPSHSRPQQEQSRKHIQIMTPGEDAQELNVVLGDDGSGWLGVETREVSSEKAKDLKLSAERGVLVGKVIPDSPASKAGLKENDVVTEINGQRVEGAVQFRRMIREIPAGRTIQLTVWRDGRSQNLSATLGLSEQSRVFTRQAVPGAFAFAMPDLHGMPDAPELRELPGMDWSGGVLMGTQPRLGIDAEDLSGQLGTFFGAPDGEGVLVRDVNSGSPAEKAGLKSGDVIISVNGERIRSVGDLRGQLAGKHEDKERTVKLGVLRNRTETSLSVELPAPAAPKMKRMISHRTNI
jgi:serine protease Do